MQELLQSFVIGLQHYGAVWVTAVCIHCMPSALAQGSVAGIQCRGIFSETSVQLVASMLTVMTLLMRYSTQRKI